MFNRRAISSTEMRLLGESANPSALDCALPAMASPDVIHVNPRRARHRTCDRPRPGPIAAFPHDSADLDLRPKTPGLVGAHAVRLGFCQSQQLKGVREIFARLKSPARYPFASAQHEPVRSRSPLHHTLPKKPCQGLRRHPGQQATRNSCRDSALPPSRQWTTSECFPLGAEPLEVWRFFSRQAKMLMGIAANLQQGKTIGDARHRTSVSDLRVAHETHLPKQLYFRDRSYHEGEGGSRLEVFA